MVHEKKCHDTTDGCEKKRYLKIQKNGKTNYISSISEWRLDTKTLKNTVNTNLSTHEHFWTMAEKNLTAHNHQWTNYVQSFPGNNVSNDMKIK